jgi:hypothetical protein
MSKRIYQPESTVQADLLRAILKERGIESNLENDDSSQWNYRSITAPLSISVAEADEARALAILQEHFDGIQNTAERRVGFAQRVYERRKSRLTTLILFYLIIFIAIVVIVVFLSMGRLRH